MIEYKKGLQYLQMYIAFFVFSFSTIFSKLASKQNFLSIKYILCFIGLITVLGIYAIFWQQILKIIPLSVAMSNKPITLIFTLFWSYILFEEKISVRTIIGIIIVLVGIFLVGNAEHEQ